MNKVDFASYADDNTPFFVGKDLDYVISKLQNASKTLFQWFNDIIQIKRHIENNALHGFQ